MQKLERLENESDFFATQQGQAGVFQSGRIDAVKQDATGRREIHCAGEIEQRGFAAAAAPDKRDKFAAIYVERNIAEARGPVGRR